MGYGMSDLRLSGLKPLKAGAGTSLGALWRSFFPSRQFLHERDGVALPPPVLRAAGPLFQHDAAFRSYAMRDARLMRRFADLKDKAILDFGCGVGRLYFGLRGRDEPASYLGVDVKPDVIAWAQKHVTAANPRFSFRQADVRNERYNSEGAVRNEVWAQSFDRPFDIIYCYSVLSHLTETDAVAVLDLFCRYAAADGIVFLTAFADEQTEDVVINPPDMPIEMVGPLHVVRYRGDHLRGILLRYFEMVAELPAAATDGQNVYVLKAQKP